LKSRPKTTGPNGVAKTLAADEYFEAFNSHNIFPAQQSASSDEVQQQSAPVDENRRLSEGSCGISSATADDGNDISEPTGNDSFATVVELTEDTISNWNTVIQCQRVLDKATKDLDEVEAELYKMDEIMIMQEPLPEERWQELVDQRNSILNTLEIAKINIAAPRAHIYGQWEQFFTNANLLRTTQAEEDFGEHYNEDNPDKHEKQITKQEEPHIEHVDVRRGEVDDGILIEADLKNVESTLRQAREVVDGWDAYRDARHADHLRLIAEGKNKDTEEDFDRTMLREALAATNAILRAQKAYDNIVNGHRESVGPETQEVEVYTESWYGRHVAEADLLHARNAYRDAKEYADGWAANYYSEQQAYLQEVKDETCSLSQTEFDLRMLDTARIVNSRFIKAEALYKKARQQALDIGVMHHEDDQSSDFPDYPDDGYRQSFEAEMIRENDPKPIHKWLNKLDSQSSCNASVNFDIDPDWCIESLVTRDTSVYDIQRRKRIDKWKSMCDEIRATLPVELRCFASSKDEKLKAALEGREKARRFSCIF